MLPPLRRVAVRATFGAICACLAVIAWTGVSGGAGVPAALAAAGPGGTTPATPPSPGAGTPQGSGGHATATSSAVSSPATLSTQVTSSSAATPSVASSITVPDLTLPSTVTLAKLQEIAGAIGSARSAVVVVGQESNLSGVPRTRQGDRGPWWTVVRELSRDTFTIVIDHPGPTGTAGALLFALASVRVVADGATISQLPAALTAGVGSACDTQLCAQLGAAKIPVHTQAPGEVILPVTGPAQSGGGTGFLPWLIVILLIAAAGAGWYWLGGGKRVLRRVRVRQPTGPAPAPDGLGTGSGGPRRPGADRPPGESRRPAPAGHPAVRPSPSLSPALGPGQGIVRTMMSPEGYVEIDGLLYRATWRGSRPAPRRGAVVAVGADRDGDLVADEGPRVATRAESGQ